MKKILFLSLLLTSSTFAANNDCIVIGFHNPGTHEYMGPTWCNNVSFNAITVYGPLYSDGSTITGTSTVNGPIKMSHSQFDTIDIKNTHTAQKVILLKNSKINGNITFEGIAGTVYVDSTSTIMGQVINGTIKKQ